MLASEVLQLAYIFPVLDKERPDHSGSKRRQGVGNLTFVGRSPTLGDKVAQPGNSRTFCSRTWPVY